VNLDLTPHEILTIAQYLIVLVLSVAVHEFGHAIVATWLGDDTPTRQGRVTLNPVAHADPIGTLILPLIFLISTRGHSSGFGWGKPVQHQPRNFTRKVRMATGTALVAIAGPAMNLLLGTLVAIVHVVLLSQHVVAWGGDASNALGFAAGMNYTLFFFNLLPIPPLDGGWILDWATPYQHRKKLDAYLVYAPFVFLAVLMIPQVQQVFLIPARFTFNHVYDALTTIFGVSLRFG
jgi:Zn-dependent protease